MRRSKRQRKVYLYLLIVLGITIGFALLSTTLYINGTAAIKSNTWDIHWDDTSIKETPGGITASSPAEVIDTAKKTVSFSVDLELPGDYYEFTVDAKNYGSINGEIDNIDITFYEADGITKITTLPTGITYTFTYSNGAAVEKGDVLAAGKSAKYKFRIEYDSNATTTQSSNKDIKPAVTIDYVQSKKDEITKFGIGEIVYFDPVNYEWCDENSQEATCYKWIVVNKGSDYHELFLLSNVSGLHDSSVANPATVIQTVTANWSNYIEEPGTQANFTSVHPGGLTDQNVDVVFKKARMLTKAEYDNLPQEGKNTIHAYCGDTNPNNCAAIDPEAPNIYWINSSDIFQTVPLYNVSTGSTLLGSSYDARPVIKVRNKKYKENEKAYNLGDLVYFDPVSSAKCDSTTFNLNDVIAGTSTCYKWRVMTIDDNVSKTEIKLQLDHNLPNTGSWTWSNDNHNYSGPTVSMTNLTGATSTWTRIDPLNYVYDSTEATCTSAGETCNYGVLTCVNGVCTKTLNNNTTGISGSAETPTRVRMVTTEEIAEIVQTKYPTFEWDLTFNSNDSAPYFSNTGYNSTTSPKGVGTKYFKWLLENTNQLDATGGTYNEYSTAQYSSNMGYWTLSPAKYSFPNFAWVVQSNGHFSNYGVDSTSSNVGYRPLAVVKKEYITK